MHSLLWNLARAVGLGSVALGLAAGCSRPWAWQYRPNCPEGKLHAVEALGPPGDFDGDGIDDLLVTYLCPGDSGDARFTDVIPGSRDGLGRVWETLPAPAAVADFTADGTLDPVEVTWKNGLELDGDRVWPDSFHRADLTVTAGDVTGDGADDLGMTISGVDPDTGTHEMVTALLAGGPNGLVEIWRLTSSDGVCCGADIAGDLDGDGHEDVLTTIEGEPHLWLGTDDGFVGDGGPAPSETLPVNHWNPSWPFPDGWGLTNVGDVDGDGADEFGTLDFEHAVLWSLDVQAWTWSEVWRERTDRAECLDMTFSGPAQLCRILPAGDHDGDGADDVLLHLPPTTRVLNHAGEVLWNQQTDLHLVASVGDLNADGLDDLAGLPARWDGKKLAVFYTP